MINNKSANIRTARESDTEYSLTQAKTLFAFDEQQVRWVLMNNWIKKIVKKNNPRPPHAVFLPTIHMFRKSQGAAVSQIPDFHPN